MKIDDIKQKLSDLDSDILKDFVLELYIQQPDLKQQIETLVLINDPKEFAKAINKRIQSVKRGRKFISYRDGYDFARNLESILADIERGLLDSSPKHAFDLADKFLATADKVLERCDDSAGDISGVYRDSVLIWLNAAKNWNTDKINWLERVYEMFNQNEYGVLDDLLPNSHLLLSQEQLKQLAWRFESELRQAIKNPAENDNYNWAASRCEIGLRSMAEALSDSFLYEKATLIRTANPNELQMKSLIKMHLKHEQTEQALKWLNKPWSNRFASDRLELLEEAYQQNGDNEALKKIRYDYYLLNRDYFTFKRYLEMLEGSEIDKVLSEAINYAIKGNNLLTDIKLLIQLNEIGKADDLLLSNVDQLDNCFYDDILDVVKLFEQHSYWLDASVCYRALLSDILLKARSKAYSHAAKYFKKIVQLDTEITDYKNIEALHEFIENLKVKHGKKYSFWNRVV